MLIDWLFLLLLLGGGIVLFFLIFFVIRGIVVFFLKRNIYIKNNNTSLSHKKDVLLRAQREYIVLLEKHITDLEKADLEKNRQLVKKTLPVHKPHELLDVNHFN